MIEGLEDGLHVSACACIHEVMESLLFTIAKTHTMFIPYVHILPQPHPNPSFLSYKTLGCCAASDQLVA